MNPRSEWFKRNTQSESIRRIPTSDSLGLKDWSGFNRIQGLGLTRIETDWFLTKLHQTKMKTFFGLTRISSDWRGNRFRNKSDWFGINFNPKLLPGINNRLMGLPFFLSWHVCQPHSVLLTSFTLLTLLSIKRGNKICAEKLNNETEKCIYQNCEQKNKCSITSLFTYI